MQPAAVITRETKHWNNFKVISK